MPFTLDELRSDIVALDIYEVYQKYIISEDNWYFENILSSKIGNTAEIKESFNAIISTTFHVNPENIVMVGSGKTGYSLTPTAKDMEPKLFKSFCADGKERKSSDIDIAIISEPLFYHFWLLLRKSFQTRYIALYNHIPGAIYRGYINETNLERIAGCRKDWSNISGSSKKELHSDLFIDHDIKYRIYRNWFDFEDYHLGALKKIKREVSYGSAIS